MTVFNVESSILEPRGGEVAMLERVVLPPDIAAFRARYEAAGGRRSPALWSWAWYLLDLSPAPLVLSCVPAGESRKTAELKFRTVMVITIIDDLAHRLPVAELLRTVAPMPYDREIRSLDPLENLADDLLREIEADLAQAPRGAPALQRFHFDAITLVAAALYAGLVNHQPAMLSHAELGEQMRYLMGLSLFFDIDIAHSSRFDEEELGRLRGLTLTGLRMLRITNWLATWERELVEGDLASGVLSQLHGQQPLGMDMLAALRQGRRLDECRDLVRASGVEDSLRQEWCELAGLLRAQGREIRSIDTDQLIEALAEVHRVSLGVRGHI